MKRNQKGQFIKGSNGNAFEGFGIYYDTKGYPNIWVDGKGIKIHVYVWERINGPKPQGFDLHHIDQNKGNWSLENIELISLSDHRKIHAGWIKENGIWIAKPCNMCQQILPLDKFYPRKGYTPSALCKTCHNKAIKLRAKRYPRNIEKLRAYKRNYYREHYASKK